MKDQEVLVDAARTAKGTVESAVDQVLRAFRLVHARLGPGFALDVYRRALLVELREQRLPVAERAQLPVTYRDCPVGQAVVDLVIDGQLIVALATTRFLAAREAAQVESVVRATGHARGLLLNFGPVAEHRLVVRGAAGGHA